MDENKEIAVLEALAQYRYLTVSQFVEIGLFKTAKQARDTYLSPMKRKRRALINAVDFGFVAGKGKLPQIHHLTKNGAEALAEYRSVELNEIRYPIGKVQFSRDYFHRVEFISLHIALRKYAERTGQGVDFWHSYFDSKGNQRQSNKQLIRDTQVTLYHQNIVPDGNFRLDMLDGESRLFTLELHKGTNTKRIIKQLENHARLVELELLPDKYDHPHDNYVLSVYNHKGTLEAVKKRFLDNKRLAEYSEYYIFNSVEQVIADFSQGWHYFNNEKFEIFRK
jgi:hypothetical protein